MLTFQAVIPSWLSLAGCVIIDFGLDVAKYAYIGGEDDDPKAPIALSSSSTASASAPTPIRYLIPLGVGTVGIGAVLIAIGSAFVPITLLIPILAVRFTTSLIFSWIVIGIRPSTLAKVGAAAYVLGLLALLLQRGPSLDEVTLLDSDAFLALYAAPAYLAFLGVSIGAMLVSALLARTASDALDADALRVVESVVLGSHAPVLAKQLSALVMAAFLTQSPGDLLRLQSIVIVGLSASSYWFWVRRLRDYPIAKDGSDKGLSRMHVGFNIAALANGVLLFQEYQRWTLATAIALGLVLAGIGILAQETFASTNEKEIETTARRSSWKEINRASTGRGSEIMRLGQPPALTLPVRNMVQIVFAPATSSASIPKKSVLMVADCRHQARKSIKGVMVDLDSDHPQPSP